LKGEGRKFVIQIFLTFLGARAGVRFQIILNGNAKPQETSPRLLHKTGSLKLAMKSQNC